MPVTRRYYCCNTAVMHGHHPGGEDPQEAMIFPFEVYIGFGSTQKVVPARISVATLDVTSFHVFFCIHNVMS